jgi:hypothetical protein
MNLDWDAPKFDPPDATKTEAKALTVEVVREERGKKP